MLNKKEKDKKKTQEVKPNPDKKQELDLDDLENVSGGGAFSNIPRVPNKDYDKSVTDNI